MLVTDCQLHSPCAAVKTERADPYTPIAHATLYPNSPDTRLNGILVHLISENSEDKFCAKLHDRCGVGFCSLKECCAVKTYRGSTSNLPVRFQMGLIAKR
jgi:hypothetical protein